MSRRGRCSYRSSNIATYTSTKRTPLELVGLSRFELLTPRLSSVCSNQLSYRPKPTRDRTPVSKNQRNPVLSKLDRTCAHFLSNTRSIFQKQSPVTCCQEPASHSLERR